MLDILFDAGVVPRIDICLLLLEKVLLHFVFVMREHIVNCSVLGANELTPLLARLTNAGGIPAEVIVLDEKLGVLRKFRQLACV